MSASGRLSDADREKLKALGLEARQYLDPAIAAVWQRLLAATKVTMGDLIDVAFVPPAQRQLARRASLPRRGLIDSSRNWSGAVCPSYGPRFQLVVGAWKVPLTPKLPDPITPLHEHRCSMWVGLDGHRRWTQSLPQVGVTITFRVGSKVPMLHAWTEWFVGGGGGNYDVIDFFPVGLGDSMIGGVVAFDPANVMLFLMNEVTHTVHIQPYTSKVPMREASAEWVVERPSPFLALDKPDPLCDYGEVVFTDCIAVSSPNTVRTLRGARLVRMVDRKTNPQRTYFISVPTKRLAANRLVVRYRG